jgi:NAD(P)-dependent dehydrogenase (short-subunit alcohol dehydrogenase family)
MLDLTNRVVIVTGAAGNLGRAVAQAFQEARAKLVLVDRAPDRLQQLYPDLVGSADHLLATSTDLAEAGAVGRMVSEAVEHFGRIDVLANTVGGFRMRALTHEAALDTWDSMFALNARTALIVSRAVVPGMLQQGQGKIVHVASRAGLRGSSKMAAYSASKSAVIRLTESMSAELKRKGINVNCVLPGTIDTPQNRRTMPNADHSRWVQPEAIAEVILFLASDAARAVHGAAIPVYGTG